MDFNLTQSLITPATVVGVIISLVQALKNFDINKKYILLIDIVLGIFFGVLMDGVLLKQGFLTGFFNGIVYGLSACGLYSGYKNLMK